MRRPTLEAAGKMSTNTWRLLVTLVLTLHHTTAQLTLDANAALVTPAPPPSPAADTILSEPLPGVGVPKPQVYSLNVRTDIRSRYARTLVTSRLANPADRAQEVVFTVVLPESAFISKFVMEVEGLQLEAYVREREEAEQEYQQAVTSGQAAGHVATASVRDANTVRVSVNVAARAKASFNLTYEELLVRRNGHYELAVNLNPEQVVQQMSVDVYIDEMRNITYLKVPAFRSTNEIVPEADEKDNTDAVVEWVSSQKVHVQFAPTVDQQRKLGAKKGREEAGLGGQFIVRYDVDRDSSAGEILALDGYFVHFFSPALLEPLPKHVVFALDVSGSMFDRKLEQLKEAMDAILGELRPHDYFNLVEFSHIVTIHDLEFPANKTVLQPTFENQYFYFGESTTTSSPLTTLSLEKIIKTQVKAFPATPEFIQKAKDAIHSMTADGGTNIYDAVRASLIVAKNAAKRLENLVQPPEPIVIFLTDGEPTVGETRPDSILSLMSDSAEIGILGSAIPTYSLAFGWDADLAFLKRLSLRSGAFARRIYKAADAALQLRDFYHQVASPLLANVTFSYLDTQVDGSSVTSQHFNLLFSGAELVVAGKLRGEASSAPLSGVVSGSAGQKPITYELPDVPFMPIHLPHTPSLQPGDRLLERMWAYITIHQMLERYEAERSDSPLADSENATVTSAEAAKAKAVKLALEFSFVTPVTSLVVVKPNKTLSTDTEHPDVYLGMQPAGQPSPYMPWGSIAGVSSGPFAGASLASAAGFASGGFAGSPVYQSSLATAQMGNNNFPAMESASGHIGGIEEISTTEAANLSVNLTVVPISMLSWLVKQTDSSDSETALYTVGNSTETYKLLSSNESAASPPECHVTNVSLLSYCRPLALCALAEYTEDAAYFLNNFACYTGEQRYLGTCCPDAVYKDPKDTEHESSGSATVQEPATAEAA